MNTVSATHIDWKSLDASRYRLSAYMHPHFVGYAVTGIDSGHLMHIEGEYLAERAPQTDLPVRKWLQTYHQLLNIPFGEVHIGVFSHKFTLLPRLELRADLALAQLCGYDSATETLLEEPANQDTILYFAVPRSLVQLLSDHFSRKTICFGEAGWLKTVTAPSDTSVSAHLVGSDLLVAAAEEGSLRYLNRFEAHNPDEILYYILLAYNLLGYDAHEVPLYLGGLVEKVSPVYQLLYGYMGDIRFCGETEQQNTDIHQPETSPHYYTNLLRL